MKRDFMDILACPVCKGALELTVDSEQDGEIVQGSLRCAACDETYPVSDGIPNLLPPDLRAAVSSDAEAAGLS